MDGNIDNFIRSYLLSKLEKQLESEKKSLKQIIAHRLEKLDKIRQAGHNPYPYNYSVDTKIIDIINDPKTYLDKSVKIAGRLISLR